MQRFITASSLTKSSSARIVQYHQNPIEPLATCQPCDIFISHRGIDTKRTISGLLHNHLMGLGMNPFLDSKNMKPGDRLFEKIDAAIRGCKIGLVVFSPRYCDSYFCLHELGMMMECRKRVIPIFCNVKPSQLCVRDDGLMCHESQIRRFRWALEEAKYTVGLTFNTYHGDWSELLKKATDAVMKNLLEVESEKSNTLLSAEP